MLRAAHSETKEVPAPPDDGRDEPFDGDGAGRSTVGFWDDDSDPVAELEHAMAYAHRMGADPWTYADHVTLYEQLTGPHGEDGGAR